MPRRFLRKWLPAGERIRANRFFGKFLHHPNLWHLNRRSVAGGVAVGLFSGLIPGPVQMFLAAMLSIFFRVNLPVALLTTLYSNPITIVPLYILAYKIGAILTGSHAGKMPKVQFEYFSFSDWIPAFFHYLASLGKPLAVGLPVLAALLSAAGYFLVRGLWRMEVVYRLKKRRRNR